VLIPDFVIGANATYYGPNPTLTLVANSWRTPRADLWTTRERRLR
jgi:hypothetical protein